MSEAFRLGGWGMWPTLVFGVLMLAIAILYTVRADQRLSSLLRTTGWMTFISGCLGFVTGLIRSCLYISDVAADDRYLVVIGFGESLVNIAWALGLIMTAMVVATVGTWRISQKPAIG
jgi:hypothetical protein